MNTKKIILISVVVLIAIVLAFFVYPKDEVLGFKVDTVLLKSVINEKEETSRTIKITNLESFRQSFQINVKHLENLIFLNENDFKLDSDDIKNLQITFKDESLKYSPGVYTGALIVKTELKEKEIPIILEIQSRKVLFATNLDVSPKYKEIEPGEKPVINIRVFNLKDLKTHSIEMVYLIKNFNGETIISETEHVVVGTEVTITKTISLPEDIPLGKYAFAVIAKYDSSTSTSSYLFNVAEKNENIFFKFDINYFFVIILIFLLGIMVLVYYIVHDRNKLFLELKKQHKEEMKLHLESINKQKRLLLSEAKVIPERKNITTKFKKIKKEIVKEIKQKQKKQEIEFKKLKKQKKENKMKEKLEEWRKGGFNVDEFLIKTTKLSKKDKKRQIQKWKKDGFDISVLKK